MLDPVFDVQITDLCISVRFNDAEFLVVQLMTWQVGVGLNQINVRTNLDMRAPDKTYKI